MIRVGREKMSVSQEDSKSMDLVPNTPIKPKDRPIVVGSDPNEFLFSDKELQTDDDDRQDINTGDEGVHDE